MRTIVGISHPRANDINRAVDNLILAAYEMGVMAQKFADGHTLADREGAKDACMERHMELLKLIVEVVNP